MGGRAGSRPQEEKKKSCDVMTQGMKDQPQGAGTLVLFSLHGLTWASPQSHHRHPLRGLALVQGHMQGCLWAQLTDRLNPL